MSVAQTIQIFLPSGDPSGIRVASLTTRTVRVFEVPRPLLGRFLSRPESSQVGVYYLFGKGDDDTPQAYVGQTGNVGERLKQHSVKDFWTKAMVAVSLTNEWTATHVSYLEWLSIRRAVDAGRYELVNGTQGSKPFTPEPLEADCVEFLDTIAVLLATLGEPILEAVRKAVPRPDTVTASKVEQDLSDEERQGSSDAEGQELLYFREAGCNATGYQTSEGLLVLAGSEGRSRLRPSAQAATRRQRDSVLEQQVVRVDGAKLIFVKDHLFRSPSAAGGLLVGGSNNGRISWKNARGQDLNTIEAIELSAQAGGAASATLPMEY